MGIYSITKSCDNCGCLSLADSKTCPKCGRSLYANNIDKCLFSYSKETKIEDGLNKTKQKFNDQIIIKNYYIYLNL